MSGCKYLIFFFSPLTITESLIECGILNEEDKELNPYIKGFIGAWGLHLIEKDSFEKFLDHGHFLETTLNTIESKDTIVEPKEMVVATLFNRGNLEFPGKVKYCYLQCGDTPEMERLYLYILHFFKRKHARSRPDISNTM